MEQARAHAVSFPSFTMESSTLNAQKMRTASPGVQLHRIMILTECGDIALVRLSTCSPVLS